MTIVLSDGTRHEQLEYVGAIDGNAYFVTADGEQLIIRQDRIVIWDDSE